MKIGAIWIWVMLGLVFSGCGPAGPPIPPGSEFVFLGLIMFLFLALAIFLIQQNATNRQQSNFFPFTHTLNQMNERLHQLEDRLRKLEEKVKDRS